MQFISTYRGTIVTVLLNSSVNLTWGFSNDFNGNDEVRWGLKQDGINMFINNGELVVLDPSGNPRSIPNIPADYKGRAYLDVSLVIKSLVRPSLHLVPLENLTKDFTAARLIHSLGSMMYISTMCIYLLQVNTCFLCHFW